MAKIEDKISPAYLNEYYKNEADANKQMSFANAFAGLFLVAIWLLYLFKIFIVHDNFYIVINIAFPLLFIVLVTPIFYVKTDKIKKPRYKYFLLFTFLLVISILNIIIPKHGILGWALCIAMANHYYNPSFGRKIFIASAIMMLVCIYAAMFVGEYDPNLIGNGIIEGDKIVYPDDPVERFNMMNEMIANGGENRYVRVFFYYYLTRLLFLFLCYFISYSLNKRTYKLLVNEIRVNSEQEKTNTELKVASEIQLSTLPTEFVTNSEIEIQAELKAAKTVGGDFYDYFILNDELVAMVIGDVSGKGIAAAMFMMKTITCFKNFISADKNPSVVLKEVNKTIYEGNDSQMFVTCFLAIINVKTGLVKFANAGHNPPIVGSNLNYRYLKCNSGFILGGLPDAYVVDEEFTLNKGETITLYTDGITEARDPNGGFYGEDRLLNLFNHKKYSCIIELHHDLKDSIIEFANGAEQSDDMTYITLKYHGDEYFYEEKEVAGIQENIPELLEFLKTFSEKYSFDKSFIRDLLVVGDELISNIVKHGYKDKQGSIFMRLLYNIEQKEFILTIIDTCEEFNPFELENKPLEGDISNTKEGGLGILIVKNLMSEYAYDRINNKNIVAVRKKF